MEKKVDDSVLTDEEKKQILKQVKVPGKATILEAPDGTTHCDFCYSTTVETILPCKDFVASVIDGQPHVMLGGWAACPECNALFKQGDNVAVLVRMVTNQVANGFPQDLAIQTRKLSRPFVEVERTPVAYPKPQPPFCQWIFAARQQ
jgi:hypothetical protein